MKCLTFSIIIIINTVMLRVVHKMLSRTLYWSWFPCLVIATHVNTIFSRKNAHFRLLLFLNNIYTVILLIFIDIRCTEYFLILCFYLHKLYCFIFSQIKRLVCKTSIHLIGRMLCTAIIEILCLCNFYYLWIELEKSRTTCDTAKFVTVSINV